MELYRYRTCLGRPNNTLWLTHACRNGKSADFTPTVALHIVNISGFNDTHLIHDLTPFYFEWPWERIMGLFKESNLFMTGSKFRWFAKYHCIRIKSKTKDKFVVIKKWRERWQINTRNVSRMMTVISTYYNSCNDGRNFIIVKRGVISSLY